MRRDRKRRTGQSHKSGSCATSPTTRIIPRKGEVAVLSRPFDLLLIHLLFAPTHSQRKMESDPLYHVKQLFYQGEQSSSRLSTANFSCQSLLQRSVPPPHPLAVDLPDGPLSLYRRSFFPVTHTFRKPRVPPPCNLRRTLSPRFPTSLHI